ncbi:hypothetical protein SPRG_06708 [Saprolegnia parasitica CBS 223.65]|uniref:Uncharacterized protein n=1 Tax=Saprolegnia parasitica (strain CBS 223.65) TaxID=695850 RepID=A0A067CCG7_SAPPC|nr:hypothetical protein SPRG_06708 [Saprolegnia parasitica CBS 223.65]KDO28469.1 hypothetical protein SPRG_06708 [Saprolegnia parasitica CBS 223.65]|eukprot:XP_012200908.1 hypothetical protein SPRG_06708 [Saprolegnia parasitica CBS 223.65]
MSPKLQVVAGHQRVDAPLTSPEKRRKVTPQDDGKQELKSPEELADAMAFVQKSYVLAKRCMDLQQYGCAFRILAKVEATTRLIAKESRRGILSKVNNQRYESNQQAESDDDEVLERVRKVSFSDDVCVGTAEDIDRSISPVARPSVEEMLFVRACRDIPTENYTLYNWALNDA